MLGSLSPLPAKDHLDLLSPPVAAAVAGWPGEDLHVAEIDPELSDTAAFCERYGVDPADAANCVIVSGKREGDTRFAACVLLATTRADVNGSIRRQLDVRKASFAPMDVAVSETGMEYGAITPFGRPPEWPLLVDAEVLQRPLVIVGSGVRRSKLLVPGRALGELPGARVVAGLATAGDRMQP